MVDELEEARERAHAAWSLVEADVVRLKEALRAEVDHVRELGPRSLFDRYPLVVLGGCAGLGLILGARGGRRRAAYRAIVRAGTDVVSEATRTMAAGTPRIEKPLARKLLEATALAVVTKGAQLLAEIAQSRVQERLAVSEPRRREEPEVAREGIEKHLIVPHGNL